MQSPNPPINPPSFRPHYSSNTNYIISYTMARFSLVFAAAGVLLLVAMAAVAEASTIYTTTTFEENPMGRSGTESDCYQRMMDQDMLSQCGMYLMKNLQGGRRQSAGEEKEMCCMQLRKLGEECMCPGIKMMMNQPMWSRMQGQMMDQMMNMAQNLPTQCNLIMSQPCQMRAVWF
ncbi:hypothetical protein L1987_85139 [Smallanthus sonchifolius]|uniref:Uncharacterized protein n=1 Tax=Smallanthus sonchifolius TaxID=185202 RepID=A0ACB8XV42_9ASTR|nr:hypothetical protein L1987_85139 [Smallanthus sonchifolius]